MNLTAAVLFKFLLLGSSTLAAASSAHARKLQRQHLLFGKCTGDDFRTGGGPSAFSFLQEEPDSPPTEEECMQLLSEEDSLFAAGIAEAEVEDEEQSEPITAASTVEEAVARATELLQKEHKEGGAIESQGLKKSISLFRSAATDSTILVLGLGLQLVSLSKMAKNVIAVETDYTFCREFMNTKAGACVKQQNVHIYCPQPSASTSAEEAEAEEVQRQLEAAEDLMEDLVQHQFGDVPVTAVAVFGSFPAAKLALMQKFEDQSTAVLLSGRISAEGLKALSGSFRVLAAFEPDPASSSHSTKTLLLLQRLFTPPSQVDIWRQYTAKEWELQDNPAILTLWNTVNKVIEPIAAEEGVSRWTRGALFKYLQVHAHAAVTGTDEDWKNTTHSLQAILAVAGKGEKAENVIIQMKESALNLAWKAAKTSGVQEYFQLLLDFLAIIHSDDKMFIHAVICELIADTGRFIASPSTLDKVKDAIEEACELAEKDPQLLLPSLRLIRIEMNKGEKGMVECLRILVKMKEYASSSVDITHLVAAAAAKETVTKTEKTA
ncbi:hypothetical protein, conserved [Eimeria brunetti]|uniref:Uncharacterized protein n=1 Tax=Eimeria brunetti TaxID=51314 RepID=U6LPX0_9EIME|nr:hypothetical protein, conserved [Eimeria brunetti]